MFDRSRVKLLRIQLEAHLKELADKLDVNIQLSRATFTPNNVTFKMEVAKIGDDGLVVNSAVIDFQRYAVMYGLQPDDLHRTFVMDSRIYKIVGLKTRRSKYPVLCECNGKVFKLSPQIVKIFLKNV